MNIWSAASRGIYEKVAPVWAKVAEQPGQTATKEGVTHFQAGAYLKKVYPEN